MVEPFSSMIYLTPARGCRRTFAGQEACRVGGVYYNYNWPFPFSFDPNAGTWNAFAKHDKLFERMIEVHAIYFSG